MIPEVWLDVVISAEEQRAVYLGFLVNRLSNSSVFVEEAERARQNLV